MAKARPHAQIYYKWLQAIDAAAETDSDKYLAIRFIINKQIRDVYGIEFKGLVMTERAMLIVRMLLGDVDELIECHKEKIEKSRQNGKKVVITGIIKEQ